MTEEVKLTPMMKQYLEVKKQCQDQLLFFRLGDFYEMFFDDAITASRELDLTLTGRAGGNKEKVPMCGVPFHSADTYIERLVQKGYKVAICEQMEDPKMTKGIVKRQIIKVVTPGTITMEHAVAAKQNNYIGCIMQQGNMISLALAEVTTGECMWMACSIKQMEEKLFDILSVYTPRELVIETMASSQQSRVKRFLETRDWSCTVTAIQRDESIAYETLPVKYFSAQAVEKAKPVLACIGVLLKYIADVMKSEISHMNLLIAIDYTKQLVLDAASLRHLEVTQNVRDGGRKGTLLEVLDHTQTAMGGRLLRKWLESPLLSIGDITYRQDSVAELVQKVTLRQDLVNILSRIFDFERILTRIEIGTVNPKDMVALRESLAALPAIKQYLAQAQSRMLKQLATQISVHDDMYTLLMRGINDNPGTVLRNGGVIRSGFSAELDEIRRLAADSQTILQELEATERERTGIKMKIGYTKVFGYYFEISHANTKPIPDYYVRKQTLVNAERYITPDLKEFEVKVLTAQERMLALETALFATIREDLQQQIAAMQETARALAQVDCLVSLAVAAQKYRYIRPQLNTERTILIRDGRHPIIERFLKSEVFVPNDVQLNHNDHEILVLTGPNMAGKSTYMRQVAVLVLMTQIGAFIPAKEASICPVDRIFTRIGASDDILTGQSTFMVEMKEVAYILKHATMNSLLIFDEIGRGTSTFDGMSIARAVIEYVESKVHALTLFATHYHELIDMSDKTTKIKNYTVAVKERGKDITFLRRIIAGGADRSYGLHVARLAGVPESLLSRAEVILKDLEAAETRPCRVAASKEVVERNIDLFTNPIIDALVSVDVMALTPIEAISFLYKLQTEAKEGSGMK
ncbi:DNA mismatch repair protein MutS [Megasphaera sp. UPII 135-E]|nr:DNA mismatch repair protein MutS [Megasphaera sp. UPII 135-E]